jgi:hypothetical protein
MTSIQFCLKCNARKVQTSSTSQSVRTISTSTAFERQGALASQLLNKET